MLFEGKGGLVVVAMSTLDDWYAILGGRDNILWKHDFASVKNTRHASKPSRRRHSAVRKGVREDNWHVWGSEESSTG